MVVGLAATLATANVLTHYASLHRAAPTPFEPPAPVTEPSTRPMAKAHPPAEFGKSVLPASYRHDRD
jgi:hypothetical protein